MSTHPNTFEILGAVIQWIEEIQPQLNERNTFLARVAVNALATVERELEMGDSGRAAAKERLAQWLKRSGELEELTRELCDRLRSGEVDVSTPGLLGLLRSNTLMQLAIDQPRYRHSRSG
ncbi:MAG: hypothetical protein FJY37_00525 [Betaproteobacteria bacterium]|nr:hypothetical protein [Betaproteobacteria bacterium]